MTITYRYFAHPHELSAYSAAPSLCAICGCTLPGYRGPYRGPMRVSFVCEECLASGRLEALDLTTNKGDRAALEQQLRKLRPELSSDELTALVISRSTELEYRTPHLVTWQQLVWPAHCGDYCRHLKEVGKLDLTQLAPDGNGLDFLARHLLDTDPEQVADLWSDIRPDSPVDSKTAYSVGMYLFQCLECAEYVILWDCD